MQYLTYFKEVTAYIIYDVRSKQTIDRKKNEARAERELAARKREEAKRAKDEVKSDNFDRNIKKNIFW